MWSEVVLAGLTTQFAYYMVADAVIFDRPRVWLIARGWWPYLLSCPYCLIAWFALFAVVALGLPALTWGAIWWFGLMANFTREAVANRVDP